MERKTIELDADERRSTQIIKEQKQVLAKITYSGEPRIGSGAGAGIQNRLKILDSGSRFALNTMRCRASLARNDDFPLLSRVLQELGRLGFFNLRGLDPLFLRQSASHKKRRGLVYE
jgi:hypothetical protein